MIEFAASGLNEFWSNVWMHLWQVTLILVPFFVAERWLTRAPASVTHAFWSTGLIKLFLPLAVFGGLIRGVIQVLPDTALALATQPTNAALAAVTTVLTVPALPGPPPQTAVNIPWLPWFVAGLSALWISGVVWLLARLVRDIVCMMRIGRSPRVSLNSGMQAKLNNMLRRADIPVCRVMICEAATLPSVVGFFKPTIVVPCRLVTHLSDDELFAVLVHEDAHRRRFDPLQSVVHRFCAALFYFYPLVWPLLRRLREATEFACDEAAIRRGVSTDTYTRAVSKTLQLGLTPAGFVSMAGAGNISFIKRRLDRLVSSRRSTMSVKYKSAIVAAVLLVVLGSFWPLQMAVGGSNDSGASVTMARTQKKSDQQKDGDKQAAAKTKAIRMYKTEPASKPPHLLKSEPPYFPDEARRAGTEAHVEVHLLVTAAGTVDSVTVDVKSKDHGMEFEKAVKDAIATWRFEPGENDGGEPVNAWVKMTIQFKLDNCDDAVKEKKPSKTMARPKSEPNG
jgi:TonB family protein